MKKDELKQQLIDNADIVTEIISKGNSVEIKKDKKGIVVLEVIRNKIKEINGSI